MSARACGSAAASTSLSGRQQKRPSRRSVTEVVPRSSSVARSASTFARGLRRDQRVHRVACDQPAASRGGAAPLSAIAEPAEAAVVNDSPSEAIGVTLHDDATTSFRVWAPHAQKAWLEVVIDPKLPAPPPASSQPPPTELVPGQPNPDPLEGAEKGRLDLYQSDGGTWAVRVASALLPPGAAYRVVMEAQDGRTLIRRDPYARRADYMSTWCLVDDFRAFTWREVEWAPRPFDELIIYEMHVGSFTPEGTFAAAMARLEHVRDAGFTCIQLMPLAEHSDPWGYNPRQYFAIHSLYGTPDDLRRLVDRAHELKLCVVVDVVLHHGAPDGNTLWEYDGWSEWGNGGIYHERGHDGPWGRSIAFWKQEVVQMLGDASAMWLSEFRADGLRFDSANDIPRDVAQALTWRLRSEFPGRILTAEVTPENPSSITELGFDSVWVHSFYFDLVQQHRALGRGHHGGGDWAEGWNLAKLRSAMGLHYGFTEPNQCIKYMLGSHDQVGCQRDGAWYQDYQQVGGRHRYAMDQFGGGRADASCRSAQRLWYTANVCAAGLPMIFMGTEWGQPGWWHNDEHHRLNWELAKDAIGSRMTLAMRDANRLRERFPAIRRGWANILHEDRQNGVMAWERVYEGDERVVCVFNAGRRLFTKGDYGMWVGSGRFQEVFCSSAPEYSGNDAVVSNGEEVKDSYDGKLWINLPAQSTLVFKQVYVENPEL